MWLSKKCTAGCHNVISRQRQYQPIHCYRRKTFTGLLNSCWWRFPYPLTIVRLFLLATFWPILQSESWKHSAGRNGGRTWCCYTVVSVTSSSVSGSCCCCCWSSRSSDTWLSARRLLTSVVVVTGATFIVVRRIWSHSSRSSLNHTMPAVYLTQRRKRHRKLTVKRSMRWILSKARRNRRGGAVVGVKTSPK